MKTLLAALAVAGALLLGAATAGGAAVQAAPPEFIPHAPGGRTLLHAAQTASSSVGCGSISCAAYETGINTYFQDVAADSGTTGNDYGVDTQYYEGAKDYITYQETYGGSYVDTNAYPASATCPASGYINCLTESQLTTEIGKDITAKGWTANGTTEFFILLPAGVNTCWDGSGNTCASNAFCAYHDYYGSGGIFAVEPFNAAFECFQPIGQGTPNGAGIDETVNTISHEQNESITDPFLNAWLDQEGHDEIGDLCEWGFGSALGTVNGQPYNEVINGDQYSLQQEYSNADGGCVQRPGGTASGSTDPTGHPPLHYYGGAIMKTNTVYTIFWIPAAPANSIAPVVTGAAGQGKTLSTTPGTWNGVPTSYAYKWQRCDTNGANCADIALATSANYILTAADVDHEIRSEVSASNGAGSTDYIPSAPTAVVVPPPAAKVAPVVSGAAAVGKTLSTTDGTWNTSVSYAYAWLRCSASGTGCVPIAGATTSGYKVVKDDAGHELEAQVYGTNAAATTSATSAATDVVVDVPKVKTAPRLSGTAKVGKKLTVSTGSWTESPTSFSYDWLRCSASGGSCKRIASATGRTYTLSKKDAGHRLRAVVTARNAAGSYKASTGKSGIAKK